MSETSTFHGPSLVFGAFIASHVEGRRVAIVGDSDSGLAEQIAEHCGRRVHLYDPDPDRLATSLARAIRGGQRRQVSLHPLEEDLDVPDGAFDVVLLPELEQANEPEAMVALGEQLLTRRGLLLVASINPQSETEGLGYYELYDLVSERFEHVSMLGHAPFYGATVADFAAEQDPPVTIDSSLVSSPEEPTHFVAVASSRPFNVDPYTVVQLPATSMLEGDEPHSEAPSVEALSSEGDEDEIEKLTEQLERYDTLCKEHKQHATALAARLSEVQQQLEEALESNERDQQNRQNQQASELEEAVEYIERLEEQLETMHAQLAETSEKTASDSPETGAQLDDDIARLEKQLAEQGSKVTELSQALSNSEEVAKRAISELKRSASQGDAAASAKQSDAHDRRLARYEADLQAARWEIDALRNQVASKQKQDG